MRRLLMTMQVTLVRVAITQMSKRIYQRMRARRVTTMMA